MSRPARDHELVQIVDAALADATRRALRADGTSWLSCRPGCTSCCYGLFAISALDAERLRAGLEELARSNPEMARGIRQRASDLVEALSHAFPGNAATGTLSATDDEAWDTFADLPETDVPCPVLDPEGGRCLLYSSRPMTCRVFGPPIRNENGIGMCELCYVGASESEILAGEMACSHSQVESDLERELPPRATVIPWALLL